MDALVNADRPRYLVAKFIPDLRRLEPRNVGIVLWANGETSARFVGEREDGALDLRRVPGFITDKRAYEQWVKFWRAELSKPTIEFLRTSRALSKGSSRCLDALMSTSPGNFYLSDGGTLLDQLDDIEEAMSFLFGELVDSKESERVKEKSLETLCAGLLRESHFIDSPHFKEQYPVRLKVDGVDAEFHFSYAAANGTLQKLYQRVSFVDDRQAEMQKAVLSCAYMFEKIMDNKLLRLEDTAALVLVRPEALLESTYHELDLLRSVTRVIDVETEREPILAEFRELAAAS